MTRTQNSFFNFITGAASMLLVTALDFVTRTVFIRYLGKSFLGIEGLFTNILSVLSLAELGFGSAIVFKLYKPIEENDRERILVLLQLYRRVYLIIGCIVAALGIAVIPLLPRLIKDFSRFGELGLNATVIFLIYLFRTASSYWFFAYKTAFVQATQKSYILTVVGYGLSIASSLCQILVLVFFRNFILYILVLTTFTVLSNCVWAAVCDRKYPYVRQRTEKRISKEERQGFFKDCSALLLYRISNVLIGGEDNIILSAFLGLDAVAVYANYTALRAALCNICYTFTSAIQASLGSVFATGKLEWSRSVFRVVNFITAWLFGVGAIGLSILANDFITLWIGSDYVITSWTTDGMTIMTPIAVLIGVESYTTGQKYLFAGFRNAMGLFQELKYRPLISVVVNLIFSLLLVPKHGPAGCVISTLISAMTVNLIWDPIVIHKHGLKSPVLPYFRKNILYKVIIAAAGLLCFYVCSLLPFTGWLGFLLRGCICVILPSGIMTLCFFRTAEFRFLVDTVREMLRKRLNKPSETED